jgi:LAO/AO transport system kinase
VHELLAQVREGRRRAIARLITRVERSEDAAREATQALYQHTGRAHIVGITGSPGSGKSTLVNQIAKAFRQENSKVGIVAVDPSSPFTGGAILGDRIRMRDLSGDPGIFIRSMASRGSLGGLARATSAVIKILDAAGFDIILVETVGAGQAEVDIARVAHTTVVIEAPGMGDDIQSIKAGILEIADMLVVNKADRPGAANTVKALRMMLHLGGGLSLRHHGETMTVSAVDGEKDPPEQWQIKVYETIAHEAAGVPELVAAIHHHAVYLQDSSEWFEREKDRSRRDVTELLQAHFMARLQAIVSQESREKMISAVAAREMDPYTAVEKLAGDVGIS